MLGPEPSGDPASLTGADRGLLLKAIERYGSPLYVYDLDRVAARFKELHALFGGRFRISYAVKANPNHALLAHLAGIGADFDASSVAEVYRALKAGARPGQISFTGPAKREAEIAESVRLRIGALVLESISQAETASRCAAASGQVQRVVVRINPDHVPRAFGARMTGKASQFGIDEGALHDAITRIIALPHLDLVGFHVYSGSSCLAADALAENFENYVRLFREHGPRLTGMVRKLIFGTGFGIPYYPDQQPVDLAPVAGHVLPLVDALKAEPRFAEAELSLELGRWLAGPAGWLLTSVVAEKSSNGVDIRLCDAGFNNHLAACGMMGAVLRKPWRMANLSNPGGAVRPYTLVGPLCTSIDQLGRDVPLAAPRTGDVIAIENSGAYGLTSSPTRFISHPEPREVVFRGIQMEDATESRLNHPESHAP